jgi:hypothetical protein
MTYILYGLSGEGIGHQVLDPLLIGLGCSSMPPIQTIELEQQGRSQVKLDIKNGGTFLNAADITTTAFEELVIRIANFLRACHQLQGMR